MLFMITFLKQINMLLKMKGYEYNTLLTDGIGVSICFQKICAKYKENKNIDEDNELYINELNDAELEICKSKKLLGSIQENQIWFL